MEMRRAFSQLIVKEYDDEQRVITGIASTPSVDRVGDVVEPMGAKFKVPMPLLLDHDNDTQVGHVEFAKATKEGIPFRARIVRVAEDGEVKAITDKAWHLIKYKLRSFVSIGFRALDEGVERLESGGFRFKSWEWLELSLVSIPANMDAVIFGTKSLDAALPHLKSIDAELMAASGRESEGVTAAQQPPASREKPRKPVTLSKGARQMSKPISEHIAALEETRGEKHARMDEVVQKSIDEGRSMDEAEKEEFDDIEAEIASIDADLKRFKSLERTKAATAKPVEQVRSVEHGTQARAGVQIKRQEKLEPGVGFARLVRCKGLAHVTHESPREIAKQLYGENSSTFGLLTKASVVAGANISGNWAEDLVGSETNAFADFVEFLRPMTILGKFGMNGVPSLRRVPFRVPLISQTGGGQGYWVGEGKPKPLTAFDFSRTTLEPLKVANICAVTMETLRDSSPSAEGIIRDSLAAALAERLDTDFIDPAKTASAGVSPASITNGVTAPNSAGATADDVRADIHTAFSAFIAANNPPTSGVWIMSAQTALTIGLMLNALGQPEFAGMSMNGGTLAGLPVITSEYIGSVSAGTYIYLVNASDIYLADEGGVSVDMSREASVQMLDNPTNDSVTPTATSMVSFWQTNTVGFLAERTINWSKRRPSAVAAIDSVAYALT